MVDLSSAKMQSLGALQLSRHRIPKSPRKCQGRSSLFPYLYILQLTSPISRPKRTSSRASLASLAQSLKNAPAMATKVAETLGNHTDGPWKSSGTIPSQNILAFTSHNHRHKHSSSDSLIRGEKDSVKPSPASANGGVFNKIRKVRSPYGL
jgi:hypothetical protein